MVTSSYCSISRSNCRNDDDELTTVWNFQDSRIIVIARVFHFSRPFLAPRLARSISKLATLIVIVGQLCRLDVTVHEFGESYYNEKIPPVIQEFEKSRSRNEEAEIKKKIDLLAGTRKRQADLQRHEAEEPLGNGSTTKYQEQSGCSRILGNIVLF
jgi:hypothetical protein